MSSSSSSTLVKRKKLTPDLVSSEDDDKSTNSESLLEGDEEVKAKKNNSNEYYFDLGKKRRITIRKWKGNCYVDIREFYEDGGELKPGKKGISLSLDQWEMIKKSQSSVDKEISRLG